MHRKQLLKAQTLIVCHATEPRASDYHSRSSSQKQWNYNIRFEPIHRGGAVTLTFFFMEITVSPNEKLSKQSRQQQRWPVFLEIMQKHMLTCLWPSMGDQTTMLMQGLDCSPNGSVRTNFENVCKISAKFATGKRWAILC